MEEYRDSVKSGYLLEKFRLFHLKDKKPKEYEYHYHDFHKLLWFISGNVEYHIEGKAYKLEPHDILLINSGQIHKPFIGTDEPYERYVFYISKEFLEEHSEKESSLGLCFQMAHKEEGSVVRLSPSDSGLLFETVKLLEQAEKEQAYASEMYRRILFLKLLIELNRCCIRSCDVFHKMARYDKKIVEMIHYINDHLKEDLSIENISSHFYLSKYHMMRKFKEETGYSMHQYIVEKRILAARNMILSGTPATTACMECGFKDYSTFSRAYRKLLNRIPSDDN
ncbi:MAG: AraC family transcriptional regulator [Lachnospiraceae bacterium]|nr:AraC family transcriptional regulator [Lachnospiraceae bacterium]